MYKSIAIDGPAGAGKSSISKLLAKKINFHYLDTGAMYRACTYFYLLNNIDVNDEKSINENIDKINLTIENGVFYLNGKDITKEIRSDEVTKNVSLISSYKKIRENLVDMQRNIAKQNNIILDGRDIGSHVLKDASIKFYLTADAEVRANRRLNDDAVSSNLTFEEILEDIKRRDYFDSHREITPLVKADDAILIDSSNLSIDQVIDLMIKHLEKNNVI
ncbi:(d)CMP kinase [Helcococcus ovis]|uniref:Cytidylate kinase n=2 Tax=Helcococcus ovis TaxID=72026 RepID=A0A4R9C027_9FIRM|nr:(d)CMP kinase [Helcococcus ovis]TFF64924.1 (d)CMP kinase [Helcococcus ovis]TFF65419.1 (d)CMP kinase [Helcococcus ovis]TFF68139.1 (d)CMP kinase [Helcococcus ovis]WNZ01998.1 (d)CMP kinase [Helcococcus ovis]